MQQCLIKARFSLCLAASFIIITVKNGLREGEAGGRMNTATCTPHLHCKWTNYTIANGKLMAATMMAMQQIDGSLPIHGKSNSVKLRHYNNKQQTNQAVDPTLQDDSPTDSCEKKKNRPKATLRTNT